MGSNNNSSSNNNHHTNGAYVENQQRRVEISLQDFEAVDDLKLF